MTRFLRFVDGGDGKAPPQIIWPVMAAALAFVVAIVFAIVCAFTVPDQTIELPPVGTPPAPCAALPAPPWSAFFSPRGGCTDGIVLEIRQAKKSIRVQAYSFTSHEIAAALIAAHERGVHVELIIDGGQRPETSLADELAKERIAVWRDEAHAIAHNKVMVIDEKVVITGSFNFTSQAEERNAENVLIVRDPQLAEVYSRNWEKHRAHAKAWK